MMVRSQRGRAGPVPQGLWTVPRRAGRVLGAGNTNTLLIQLSPEERGHRRVAFGAVSEPAAIMPRHGAAAGAESDLTGTRKDIL